MIESLVRTKSGTVQGKLENNVHVFRGVPYAAPPIGDLRWRPPQNAATWEGHRDCTKAGPSSWQLGTQINDFMNALIEGVGHGFLKRKFIKLAMKFAPKTEESEDCLYLNIRSPDLEGSLPVMLWMHGGDHQDGSGSEVFYESNTLPELGVVLITINYRLGLMGYFCHRELSKESRQGVSGNYGTLDQIASLHWVQKNIESFGGDPANVTVFGESAGGESVAHMLTSPLAKGLFHRAILQSAANSSQMQYLSKDVLHHKSAEDIGDELARKLVGGSDCTVQKLRQIPADMLMSQVRKEESELGGYYPVIDGYVLPYSPFECFERGLQAKVPIMIGSNSDEGSVLWPMMGTPLISHRFDSISDDSIANLIRQEFGDDAERLFELYPGLENGASTAQTELLGDSMFGDKAYFYATRHAVSGESSYLYYFNQTSPLKKQTAGAFHASEIAYVFGSEISILPIDDDGRDLSKQMSRYWRNFAHNGDPSDNELSAWPAYQKDSDQWMVLGKKVGLLTIEKKEKYEILIRRLSRELASLVSGRPKEIG